MDCVHFLPAFCGSLISSMFCMPLVKYPCSGVNNLETLVVIINVVEKLHYLQSKSQWVWESLIMKVLGLTKGLFLHAGT